MDPASLAVPPDPVIEAYKRDVDRTLLRENLRLTPEERVAKMLDALRVALMLREAFTKARDGRA